MLRHKTQPAAGRVINSRCLESDKEVEEDTQNIRAWASVESLPSQQAGRNHERNLPSKQHAGLPEIQSTGDFVAHGDRQ